MNHSSFLIKNTHVLRIGRIVCSYELPKEATVKPDMAFQHNDHIIRRDRVSFSKHVDGLVSMTTDCSLGQELSNDTLLMLIHVRGQITDIARTPYTLRIKNQSANVWHITFKLNDVAHEAHLICLDQSYHPMDRRPLARLVVSVWGTPQGQAMLEQAKHLASSVNLTQRFSPDKKYALLQIGSGLLAFILGLLITGVSYNAAKSGGAYVVLIGFIVIGPIAVIHGVYKLLRAR